MLDLFLTILFGMAGATLLAFAVRFVAREPVRWPLFAAALGSLLFYWAVVVAGAELQAALLPTVDLDWNWFGKIVTTGAILLVLVLLPAALREKAGFRLRLREGSLAPALICLALLCALSWGVEAWSNDGRDVSLERLAFQGLMPGLDEELFFRGLFLGLLLAAFDERWTLFGAPVGPAAAITTWIFAAGHGVAFVDGELHLQPLALGLTGLLGFGLLWIRQRTGTVLPAIVGHNLINFGNSSFF